MRFRVLEFVSDEPLSTFFSFDWEITLESAKELAIKKTKNNPNCFVIIESHELTGARMIRGAQVYKNGKSITS